MNNIRIYAHQIQGFLTSHPHCSLSPASNCTAPILECCTCPPHSLQELSETCAQAMLPEALLAMGL